MSSQIIDLEAGWQQIDDKAIKPLLENLESGFGTASRPFTNKQYMDVYRVCYVMCTQRTPYNYSEALYHRHGEMFKKYLKNTVVPALEAKTGVALLEELRRRWANHNIMNKWMFRFFRYLDKYYTEHYNQLRLMEAGNQAFRRDVFDAVKGRVTQAIIGEINRSRSDEHVQPDLVKDLVRMYKEMGEGSLTVYDNELQMPLLGATKEFYNERASSWIASDDVPTYLQKVEDVLVKDTERVNSMLLPSSETPLLDVDREVLLRQRQDVLLKNESSGLARLLQQDRRDDLARLFRLYHAVNAQGAALDPIADGFRVHFQEVGKAIVQDRLKSSGGEEGAGAGASKSKGESVDQPEFIKALLELHDRARTLVSEQFQGHTRFQKALKDAFEVVMNHTPEGTRYSNSELTAAYADRILSGKGDKLDDTALDAELERVVQLFSFINDKDVFAEEYRKFMSKRLLGQKSVSNDAERTMIGKLKLRCGVQYTSRMEGMLNDLATANDQTEEFRQKMAGRPMPGGIDFSVQVLTTVWWPSFPAVAIKLPPAMEECKAVFTKYYEENKQRKKLTWNFGQGTASVSAVFKGVKYELQVATLQAVVLAFFNDVKGTVDFETIKERLGVDDDSLKRALHSFACGKHKLLLKEPENNKIDLTDKFTVNDNFSDKMRKIRVPMATLEPKQDKNKVEDDRGHAIEAAIVRIMKARKTLGHQQLTAEVLAQLRFFKPNPKDIKKRIEGLIERDYLERDKDSQATYTYLA